VRITYSGSADTAYLYLTDEPLSAGRESIHCDTPEGVDATVIVDWKDGRVVGFQVVGASRCLPAELLEQIQP
jgi:uncharacterized protein YuzE